MHNINYLYFAEQWMLFKSLCLNLDVRCLDVRWIDEIFKIMKISELSNHLIYPSKYLKSNHLNKNINMKFKQFLNLVVTPKVMNSLVLRILFYESIIKILTAT